MDKLCWVGFDTSNYTTSAAACTLDDDGKLCVIANCKSPLPVAEGGRGLRQSDAVFAHTKNLPELVERLDWHIKGYRVAAVGYSSRPRDLEDSYMPCFLCGRVAAYSFACGRNIPVYDFSHQNGHIMAALYSSGAMLDGVLQKRFLAFHLSGGTTEAVLIEPGATTDEKGRDGFFSSRLVGCTEDINAGQAIDRVGVAMGLKFPCGKEMEALASQYTGRIPSMKICVRDGRCNLSGLENRAVKLWEETGDRSLVSAFVFSVISKTVLAMTEQLIDVSGNTPIDTVLYAGGVMSNKLMRPSLSEGKPYRVYFAEPAFSADNAAGIALMTAKRFGAACDI